MAVSVTLPSGRIMKYIGEKEVESNLIHRGFKGDVSLTSIDRSDITRHVYEGGFKVWECSIDLCALIENNQELFLNKRVIELGCGAGLPAILTLIFGAECVAFQDFNSCVVECFTKDNIILNGAAIEKSILLGCDWKNISGIPQKSFDVVLTSETIYNQDDYESLHNALDFCLSPDGFCWLAAKFFYFGLTGDVPSFMEFVKSKGVFDITQKLVIDTSVPRRILEIKRKLTS